MAAYYSVIGLASIFVGAFWPVVFMGSLLEVGKLVTASWLYQNWKKAPLLLKSYLTFAVLVLMLITSMGIFGFLAKAHIESTLDSGVNTVELKTLTVQENNIKERLNYLLARAKDPSTASNKLDNQIQQTQKELNEISKKKLPLLREETKLIADIGPIKYVAELIYGQAEDGVDKAVRLVIMIIMVVFDPLAVLLLIAANISLKQNKEAKESAEEEVDETKEWFEKIKAQTKKLDEDRIEVEKENIASIEEEPILIDGTSGESIPPIGKQGKRGFPNRKSKIETKYDYDAELAFREKESK